MSKNEIYQLRNEINNLRKRILDLEIIEQKHKKEIDFLREIKAKLNEKINDFETILETVPAAIWIAHDKESKIVSGNSKGAEILKLSRNDNLSKTAIKDEVPDHFKVYANGKELNPEELPLQKAALESKSIGDFEELLVFDSGEKVHLFGNAEPLFDKNNNSRGAIAAFIDITDIKRKDNQIRERELLLSKVIDTLSNGLIITDSSGKVVLYNNLAKNILEIDFDKNPGFDLMNHNWNIINTDFTKINKADSPVYKAFKHNRIYSDIKIGYIKDNEPKWLLLTTAPLNLNDYGIMILFKEI